jgi:hypothetical protein
MTIKDCCLLPGFCYDNRFLIVLCTDGTLDLYNIESGELVTNLNSRNIASNHSQLLDEQRITQIVCSSNGRFMCATTHDGCIQCYDFDASHLKSMKVTSGLMKSSINSTANATRQPQPVLPIASRAEEKQRFQQKQTVSKVCVC